MSTSPVPPTPPPPAGPPPDSELLKVIRAFVRDMELMNRADAFEQLWDELPHSLIRTWREAEKLVAQVDAADAGNTDNRQ